jgi:alpha-D-ribose 1-methylphosphonate 5-triphosphate synthase subunit PhnL
MTSGAVLAIQGACKQFVLHAQGGIVLPVLENVDLVLRAGECVAIDGPSGTGKSTLLRLIYGNYRGEGGTIRVWHEGAFVEMVRAHPRHVLALRRRTIGYVSQFLRAMPRVSTLDLVAEPMLAAGLGAEAARGRARTMLARLNLPERLWPLSPATFSGGEQQRVNIARGLGVGYRLLLLDEPTAALDAENRAVVVALIQEARAAGTAIVGVFHDRDVRAAVADRVARLTPAGIAA